MKNYTPLQKKNLEVVKKLYERVGEKWFQRAPHRDLFNDSSLRNIMAAAIKPKYGQLIQRNGIFNRFTLPFNPEAIIDAWIDDSKNQRAKIHKFKNELFLMTDEQMIAHLKSKGYRIYRVVEKIEEV